MVGTVVKVRIISVDDETYYAHKKVKISSSRSFETPIKAISLQNLRNDVDLTHNEFVDEIYIAFTKERLENLINRGYGSLTKNLGEQISKLDNIEDKANILIPALRTSNVSKKELEFLADIQSFPIFEFYVVPLVEKTKKMQITAEQYKAIAANFIEILQTRNHKEIMGTLSLGFSYNEIQDLLNLYLDLGITAFCFDFEGKVAFSVFPTLSMVQATLRKEGIDPFIHATNVNIGKPSKKSNVIIAKDVLAFGFGVDSLGDDHKPKGGPKEGETQKRKTDENLRIFNKEGYSYHKVSPTDVDQVYPADTKIPKEYLIKGRKTKKRQAQKTLNYEQLGLETLRIREKIDEHEIIPYVARKQYIRQAPNLIGTLLSVRHVQLDVPSFLKNVKIKK